MGGAVPGGKPLEFTQGQGPDSSVPLAGVEKPDRPINPNAFGNNKMPRTSEAGQERADAGRASFSEAMRAARENFDRKDNNKTSLEAEANAAPSDVARPVPVIAPEAALTGNGQLDDLRAAMKAAREGQPAPLQALQASVNNLAAMVAQSISQQTAAQPAPAAPASNIPDQPSREQQAMMEANDGPQSSNVGYLKKTTEAQRQEIRNQVALEELAAAGWNPNAPQASVSTYNPALVASMMPTLEPQPAPISQTPAQAAFTAANTTELVGRVDTPAVAAPALPFGERPAGLTASQATYEAAMAQANSTPNFGHEGNRVAQAPAPAAPAAPMIASVADDEAQSYGPVSQSQPKVYAKEDVPTLDAKSTRILQETMKAAGMPLGKTGKNGDGVDGDCGPIMKEHIAKMCTELNIDPKKIALNGPLPPNKETEALMAHVVEKVEMARENQRHENHARASAPVRVTEYDGPLRTPPVPKAEGVSTGRG